MIFDEKTSSLGILNSTSSLSHSDTFGIIEYIESTVPFKGISTSSSTSIPESTGSQITPIQIVTSPDRSSTRNDTSPTPCLARWDVNMIKATGVDVRNISTGR